MLECGIFFRLARNPAALLAVSSLVFGLILSSPQKIQAQSSGEVVITNNYANIRSGPGINYRRIGRAMRGERFPVTEIRPKWYRIIFRQRPGWVFGELARLEQVSSQETDRLVEEVQILGKRIDRVLEKLDDASSQLIEKVEKTSPAKLEKAEKVSTPKKPRRTIMRKPVPAAWALVPGGSRIISGQKIRGGSMLAATVGCFGLGLYYHDQYKTYLEDYRNLSRSNQPEEFDRLYDKTQNRLKRSDGLFYAAAGLFLFNIVDHFFIMPRFGPVLNVEIENTDRAPDRGQRIHLSLSRSF